EVRSAPAGVDPSQRAGGGSPLGRISGASSRWPARLGNDLARLATTDLDVRRISNDGIKRKKMWEMTRHKRRAPKGMQMVVVLGCAACGESGKIMIVKGTHVEEGSVKSSGRMCR